LSITSSCNVSTGKVGCSIVGETKLVGQSISMNKSCTKACWWNWPRCQFHHHFTHSFCARRSQKRKKKPTTWLNSYTFGSYTCTSTVYICWWNWPQVGQNVEVLDDWVNSFKFYVLWIVSPFYRSQNTVLVCILFGFGFLSYFQSIY